MSRKLMPVVAFFVAFALFLALGELMVRLYTWKFISYDMEMTRYAMTIKERSPNPEIGHVHRPGSSATLMGVPVQINADGLRDRDYPVARTGARRYAFLGDSLTFGWGVPEASRFESLLEQKLNAVSPTEIINFGHGNYNTVQEVNLFIEKGLKYKPDTVVVFYFINDAEPTPVMSAWEFLGHSRLLTLLWSRLKTLGSRVDEHQSFQGYYSSLYVEGQPGWNEAKKAFAKLKEVSAANGIALKVVLLPELHDPAHYPFAAEHRKVMAYLAELGIPALDITPAFKDTTDPVKLWVALDDAHPNEVAHAMIARAIESFITGEGDGAAGRR
jgi:lysophospholipase L1-like esterase